MDKTNPEKAMKELTMLLDQSTRNCRWGGTLVSYKKKYTMEVNRCEARP